MGVDVLLNWDHFFPLSGDRGGLHFECWTMLGAWAESTIARGCSGVSGGSTRSCAAEIPARAAMYWRTGRLAITLPRISARFESDSIV